MITNTDKELMKIHEAFKRVKNDYSYVLNRVKQLEKENIELRNLINSLNNNDNKTKFENRIFIANKQSKKVHSQDCPYGRKINIEKREIFEDISQALKNKYKRCSCLS